MADAPDYPKLAELPWLVADLQRRVTEIERYRPAVMAEPIQNLRDELRGLKTAVWTVGGGIIVAAMTLAFTILARGGH